MTEGLANPLAARDHARAMAGTVVDAMPVLPPVAPDLPEGVEPGDLLWEETVAPGGYATRRLARGSRVRLIDLAGDACASMLIYNAEMPTERLNVADTVKVQWNGYLGAGKLLLSDMGRVMMSILEDGAATHDVFCGTSSAATNEAKYGEGRNSGAFPNGRDRLLLGSAKHGLHRRDVHPCVNLFKGTRIEADGAITPLVGPFEAGREIVLRAEMDVIVVLANCPHVLDPRDDWQVSPLRISAWRGPVTDQDDPVRCATPEGLRAFENVEDYHRR
ncbi:MAG: urea carboxylase-associated family protein [Erythrobacter sp.]|jgi:urea carboxylase-associated protein 2|uniref:urea amidolyase associated protein UAAP1 n=1 Tax=Qipengyuania citrea TaxID=225971 RepID=UPI001A39C304|nr:urea amidolyase associated protein UAAP1 [Qipengyuania citrea]MBL4717359.1 urea carboxylase-associated family protein [Erythrobacter sp.]MCP2017617.1 urea carboxylase-associated protein 2 [Qipengyuania citrea]MDE0902693.1 urea carboxylase-associated family protein [Erythrobacter sp.]